MVLENSACREVERRMGYLKLADLADSCCGNHPPAEPAATDLQSSYQKSEFY